MIQGYLAIARAYQLAHALTPRCHHRTDLREADAFWAKLIAWEPAPPICDCCGGPVLLARVPTAEDVRCLVCRLVAGPGGGHLVRAALRAGGVFVNSDDAERFSAN